MKLPRQVRCDHQRVESIYVPRANEHADGRGGGLEGRPAAHDDGANENGGPAAQAIGQVGREGVTRKGTDVLRARMSSLRGAVDRNRQ